MIEEKIIAAKALGDIRDPTSVEPLESAVRPYYEAEPADTKDITIAKGPIDEKVRLMKEKESRVRVSVVWALRQIGDAWAKEIVTRAVNDENSLVRDATTEALARINEKEEKVAAGAANTPVAQ